MVRGGRIRLLPPEINWAHRMLSQSSASSLLCWSCTHWLKCVASVISDVPLMGSHIEGGELGFNWGEPERAPHEREVWCQDVQYICVCVCVYVCTVLVKLTRDPNNSRYTLRDQREFF